ncbi:Magnesium transporter MgtE [bioreactor metagenome]|uniref:Magnesium transporter MgtE n=1 Tax=bioreactor metagenome TaxID=1076179 RepID=A0A644V625_9ZZZZ|nr:magnesium transporter [Acidaminococcaceae bacterium]
MKENEALDKEVVLHDALLAALTSRDDAAICQIVEDTYPIDLGIVMEQFSDEEILYLCGQLKDEKVAEILEHAEENLQIRLMRILDNNRIISLLHFMSKDNIVDILGDMPVNSRKEIVKLMKFGERKIIQDLLGYAEDTAGGIMTTEYISVKQDLTVSQALQKIKEIGPKTEEINTIFVLNNVKQLVGTVALRDMLLAQDTTKLSEIMQDNVIAVEPEADQEEVAMLVSKYDLHVIPVVSKRRGLLGIITVDDIIDVIVEEHTEDMLRLGGVSKEENIDSSLMDSVRMRLPWLVINLLTAFLAAFTVSMFESTISRVVALAVAMPIVAGMGGNAGTQTLAIVVRSIALGEVKWGNNKRLVLKEIFLGVINGAATGAITGVLIYFMFGNVYLGWIIFAAMICNLVIAGFFGFLVPLILKAMHADPAVASSIFITTATDVFGFFIFLGLAKVFIQYLL